MINLKRIDTEFGPNYRIFTDEGVFRILFGGNLDLYWDCYCDGSMFNSPLEKSFYITKENYYIFSLIDELYNRIKNFEPFPIESYSEMDDGVASYNNMREMLMAQDNRPFFNNKIEWYSDEFEQKDASVLRIENLGECYKVTFCKSKCNEYLTYSIRFRNSGSRYNPYNFLFMNMYNKLSQYDSNYHQIHIEEYLYQNKLVKKR